MVQLSGLELSGKVNDTLELVEEPFVYPGEKVDPVHAPSFLQALRNHEDSGIRRVLEFFLKFGIGSLGHLVADEAFRSLPDAAESFLQSLLECPADAHHLSYALHARPDPAGNSGELGEVPAGNLADYIVESRLEERGRGLGDRVAEVEEAVAEGELRGDEGERISGSLRREGGRTAQPGVDLDDLIVH